jgi:acyl-CoA synthetase (AMP-forming)/AMP-acid ligase II
LITDTKATTSGAPTFAYEMCIRRIAPSSRDGLDLSSLDTLICAGEPINPTVLERFVEAFAPHGLRASAIQPAYGLAEATLETTLAPRGTGFRVCAANGEALSAGTLQPLSPLDGQSPTIRLVSSGRAVQETIVVDPTTRRRCTPGRVGEIWIRGPAVAVGYWGKEQESKEQFRATLNDGQGTYLRTGDLGVMHEGELYVTGRIKDLLIIRGQNHYPQDVEEAVCAAHPAIRPNSAAAFGVPGTAGEELAIVVEVTPSKLGSADEVFDAITRSVKRGHRLQTHAIMLLPPRSILRTTSGKLQRQACRQWFLERRFEHVALRGPANA